MIAAMLEALRAFGLDPGVDAIVLTGLGKYYCSGADFSGNITGPTLPSTIKRLAADANYALFDAFISCPKPIVAAVNGPAIGGAVTSATLCDVVIASERATFHTPFKQLGVSPEGCSTFNFPRTLGEAGARVMLEEGRRVGAAEALQMGLVSEVVKGATAGGAATAGAGGAHRAPLGADEEEPHTLQAALDTPLLRRALDLAQARARQPHPRVSAEQAGLLAKLRAVNRSESASLADALTQPAFFDAQYRFALSRGKTGAMAFFWLARRLQPLLARL
jgi:enoyl-CoA hydratase/carnithine racemase